ERSPWKRRDLVVGGQTQQSLVAIGKPQIAAPVLDNGIRQAIRKIIDRNQSVLVQIDHFLSYRDPDSPPTVAQEGSFTQLACNDFALRRPHVTVPRLCRSAITPLLVRNDPSAERTEKTFGRTDPHSSVAAREDRGDATR